MGRSRTGAPRPTATASWRASYHAPVHRCRGHHPDDQAADLEGRLARRYAPTNTIIVTDSESNIGACSPCSTRSTSSYRPGAREVITIEHADANILGEQLSEIYGAEVGTTAGGATAAQRRSRARRRTTNAEPTADAGGAVGPSVRILTDERTNSLLVLATRQQLEDIRGLIHKLDIPVTGKGRIRVYYLKHADAEELADTLDSLLSGASGGGGSRSAVPGATGGAAQALRSVVTPLAEGVTITADAATNSLVIQASKEAYETLEDVIEQLDVSRPQVLVEALIVEVDVTDNLSLGFNAAFRLINGDTDMLFSTGTAVAPGAGLLGQALRVKSFTDPTQAFDQDQRPDRDGSGNLSIGISASKDESDINIVSAPHILTSDNEEAEIRIGNNIPIPTGRTDAAVGGSSGLSTSVSIERQDVGVTLRVTPQISEGDTLRLQIFQELTEVVDSQAGEVNSVGVTLSSRKIENTVVVNDGETVAIGGLISETFSDGNRGVPFLKDIPWLGWLFKSKDESLRKINLLVFLTPHIIRSADDLEQESIRKRIELEDSVDDEKAFPELAEIDRTRSSAGFSAAAELNAHADRYPIDRMRALEAAQATARDERAASLAREAAAGLTRYVVTVARYDDETRATETLTDLIDAGYDGTLVTGDARGRLVFTIQVGPYDELWEAERTAETLDAAYGYSSSVTVLREAAP
ncbi:MAG: type II secretion system secretin GspD [Myxococcota bacterium]